MVLTPSRPRLPAVVPHPLWIRCPTTAMRLGRALHGPVFTVRQPGGTPLVVIGDADDARLLLRDAGQDAAANEILRPLVGDTSVLVATGRPHRERRRVIRAVASSGVEDARDRLGEVVDEAISRWPAGRPFRSLDRLFPLTLELILTALFGDDPGPDRDRLRTLLLMDVTRRPSRRGALPPPWPLLTEHAAELRRLIEEALPDARDPGMVASLRRYESDRTHLQDSMVTLFVTGFETTAVAIAWCLERLSWSPGPAARVARLVCSGDETALDRYLHALVIETLRQRPVIPVLVRTLTAPVRLRHRELPAGAQVGLAAWLVQHDESVYPEARRFDPDRFTGLAPGELPRPTGRWFPFGGGPRSCLGERFAVDAARLVLERLLRSHHVRAGERGRGERPAWRSIMFVPDRGGRIILSPR